MKIPYMGVAPIKAYSKDAGFDLQVHTQVHEHQNDTLWIHTGTAVAIPEGHVGLLIARSSLHTRGWMLANAVGVIDPTYRGEIIVKLVHVPGYKQETLEQGERVAQLVIVPAPCTQLIEVERLDDTARGTGGFGSTGSTSDDLPDDDDEDEDGYLLDTIGQHCVGDAVTKILGIAEEFLTKRQVERFENLICDLKGLYAATTQEEDK